MRSQQTTFAGRCREGAEEFGFGATQAAARLQEKFELVRHAGVVSGNGITRIRIGAVC